MNRLAKSDICTILPIKYRTFVYYEIDRPQFHYKHEIKIQLEIMFLVYVFI